MNRLIYSLAISLFPAAAALAAAPGAPSSPQLHVVPDSKGLFKVEVSVTAPSVTNEGAPLLSLTGIEIKRNGETVRIVDNIEPGESQTFTDSPAENGYAVYSATATSSVGESDPTVLERVFIGVDIPLAPDRLRASMGDNRITFTWTKSATKGENGERVRQDAIIYSLEELNSSYEPVNVLTETKTQTHVYYHPLNYGKQDILRFGVRASNSAGYSGYTYARVIIGAPYYFPFRESFGGAISRSLCWQEGDGAFAMTSEESYDGDAGAMMCRPSMDGKTTSLNLGKISMRGTETPRLTFRIKYLGEGESLTVKVARADGAEASLKTVYGPIEDWTLETVDLAALKNENFIIPKFVLGASNENIILLDDIRLIDPYPTDLGVLVKAPESSYGLTEIDIEVENEGLEEAGPAEIIVYTGGKRTSVLQLEDKLQPGDTKVLKASVMVEGNESVEAKAVVSWVYDVNPANDTASAQIIPDKPATPSTSGVDDAAADNIPAEIFTPDGIRIVSEPSMLPAGVYIINGKKTVITE